MEAWFSISLCDGIMATTPLDEIEKIFLQTFIAAEKPLNMAVFTRLESEGRLHCEVIAYFSPAAKDVAKLFDSQACEKPAWEGLGLLAGDARSWSILFPESAG